MKVLSIAEQQDGRPHVWVGWLLAQAGVEMRFVLQNGSWATAFLRSKGLTVEELPLRNRADLSSLRRLRRILREFQPDIIHAYTGKTAWLAIAAQWPRKSAQLVFYRGAIRPPSKWNPADRLLFGSRWVDMYDCLSRGVAESLARGGVPRDRLAVVYYGHDASWYTDGELPVGLQQKSAKLRIGAVANYRPIKGLEVLVHAADILYERRLDFELVIAGRDDQKRLAECVAQARSRKQIRLAGPLERPWAMMRSCDCLAVPSLQEGLGKVALEAFACGVPVVASRVGGLAELIEHERNGLLVTPGDALGLADGIERLVTDSELAQRCRVNGRAAVDGPFSIERTRDELLRVYERCFRKASQP